MKASVIIPLSGTDKPLKRSLQSVISQTYKDFEIIIIADNAEKRDVKLASKLLDGFSSWQIIEHRQPRGLWDARCEGILEAKGEFILFVDPREWIAPGALAMLIASAEDFNVDLVQMKRRRTVQQKYIIPPPPCNFNFPFGKRIDGDDFRDITRYVGINSPITPFCGDKLYRKSLLKEVVKEKCSVKWGEVQIMNIHYLRQARSLVMVDSAGVYEDWSVAPEHYRFSRLEDYKNLYDIKKLLCKEQEPLQKELRTLLHKHVNELLGEMAWTPDAVAYFLGDELEKPIWREVHCTEDIDSVIAYEQNVLKHNFWKNTLRRLFK